MKRRPTLDDLQRERAAFIGPPVPPQTPKMQGRLPDDERYFDWYVAMLTAERNFFIRAPLDPETLADWLADEMTRDGVMRNRPVIDGRPHYHAIDAIQILDGIGRKLWPGTRMPR